MSSQEGMECCVCGTPSTMRCGACAKVGVELPFCSIEHQKLVWSAHKHVCGPDRAKPFNPPDLSLEEANILRLVGHDLAPYAEVLRDPQDMGGMRMLPGGRSAAQEIERAFKLKPGDFDRITMEKLTSLSSSIHPDDKSRAMIYLRMLLFMGTTGRERPDLYDQLGPTCFAAYLDRILTFWAPDTPSDVLGLALHRHVLFVGLVRAKSQALPGTSSITAEYLRGALERVLLPLSPYFRFEHAEHALGTLNTLLVPFMTQLAAPPLAP
ncbi:hypothetical protein C6P46_005890 [Rhodotorula mucilaginosa]|uniref:MYND-type domain-containing protein n=1 Tax=Rhodotorula mucilaginosa TaxID=5537 RepID=A0A9P6VXW0_RHOMI|nr:hypothetical protein C6P46_005890 [Rhodotorula mucilaginosa]